jgi:uncharacterized repeat protein (TIGR03803 family)
MTPAGQLTTLYSFCSQPNCTDGYFPYGGLLLASDGNFYGTTSQGGSTGNYGTVFKITPSGVLTTLHRFSGTDGDNPNSPLIQAANGNIYGLTANGGSINSGTFFRMTLGGTLTTLYSFLGADLNAPLIQGSDGNFYGTSEYGGTNDVGMLFKLTPSGVFSVVHSFSSTDGSSPAGGLIQASDGRLYGTTYGGGSGNSGTVFKMTLAGTLTTLHNFDSTDGAGPIAGLIQATDGNFYGTTYAGGVSGDWGTVYKMTPSGTVTVLHSFSGTDGGQPYGPVSQNTSGNIYGTATNGTGSVDGTTFGIATELAPFVSFIRSAGKVGQTVGILGQGLKNTTSVSFAGTAATFKVHSGTYLTAVVPAGAISGPVTVTTVTSVFKSNVSFRVLP